MTTEACPRTNASSPDLETEIWAAGHIDDTGRILQNDATGMTYRSLQKGYDNSKQEKEGIT